MTFPILESSPAELGFEGPEKNLQVIFAKTYYDTGTLRLIPKSRFQEMLNYAKCKILSSIASSDCISYILSESSLFVYDDRIILKTCGTTPLLKALDDIILIGQEIYLKPAAVLFWRKNYTNPQCQDPIHQTFENEVNYLREHLGGDSYTAIMGNKDKDHYYFYYSILAEKDEFEPVFNTFELKMHEIHPEKSKNFIWEKPEKSRPDIINKVYDILPGYSIDEYFFEPCGYSMNGLNGQKYKTIHITPEGNCSYISYETNDAKFINEKNKNENAIMDIFEPYNCLSIEIKNENENLNQNDKIDLNRKYTLINKEKAELGNIKIEFQYYETNELHPLAKVAKRRQQGIEVIRDVKHLAVS